MRISTLKDTRSHGAYFLFLAVMVPYVNKYGTKYISACCLLPTIKNNYARVVEGKEMIFGYAGPGWKRPTEREMPFRNSGCRFSCSNSLLAKGWGRLGIEVADKLQLRSCQTFLLLSHCWRKNLKFGCLFPPAGLSFCARKSNLRLFPISIVKPTRCTNVSNLFYFGMTLYMFPTVFLSIIRSSRLYIQ